MDEPVPPLVSYSINGEDILLRRVFAGRRTGFFIDVGAEHPIEGNDLFGLYELGWRGINIEPNPAYFRLLERERPLDTNLRVLLSDAEADAVAFHVVEGSGLSTMDAEQAAEYARLGMTVERRDVAATTLCRLLDGVRPDAIDILKVDVEGAEEAVLRGNDWSRFRPSLVMYEATLPRSPVRRPTGIRPLLEEAGYEFAYHDGLNDFFVERSFKPPADAFRPTNVFDNVVTSETSALRRNFAAAEGYARDLRGERDDLDRALTETTRAAETANRSAEAAAGETRKLAVALARTGAMLDATCRITLRLIDNDVQEVEALLTRADTGASAGSVPPDPDDLPGHGTGRSLVPVPSPALVDEPSLAPELRLQLLQGRLAAVHREKDALLETVKDLRFENRRLRDGNQQMAGERAMLQKALDQMRNQALVLGEARRAMDSVQHLAHQAELARTGTEARIERLWTEATERLAELAEAARSRPRREDDVDPERAADAQRRLDAVYRSTSWRLTAPVRLLSRALGRGRD